MSLAGNGLPIDLRTMTPEQRYRNVAGAQPLNVQMGEDIDIGKLVGAHTKRRDQRAQIYELVYRKCCQRIQYANDVQYVKECHFRVPEVQLWGGVPRYHLNAVIAYTMIKLKKKGFDVKYVPPDGIMVNWQRLVVNMAAGSLPTFEAEPEKVIRYQLDEVTTAAPNKSLENNAERLLHRGCKGDCCTKPGLNGGGGKTDLSKTARIEMDRRRQQEEIDRVIAKRDRNNRG